MEMHDYERLMHYADGEVDDQERADIEVWLARDAGARQTVAKLRGERSAIRAAFQQPAGADDNLTATMDVAFANRAAASRARTGRHRIVSWALPIAASIALAVVTGAATFGLAERRIDAAVAALAGAQAQDRQLTTAALEEALETRVSGDAVAWINPDTGVSGSVTPTRTFRATGGAWCREYRREVRAAAFQDVTVGIACRAPADQPDGNGSGWLIAVERPANT